MPLGGGNIMKFAGFQIFNKKILEKKTIGKYFFLLCLPKALNVLVSVAYLNHITILTSTYE